MHLALIPCHTRQEEWVHAATVHHGHRTVFQGERYAHYLDVIHHYVSSLHYRAIQWQRIALARAFMRAHQPEVHFLLFDEPVRPTCSFSAQF